MQDFVEHINMLSPQVPFPKKLRDMKRVGSNQTQTTFKKKEILLGKILMSTECCNCVDLSPLAMQRYFPLSDSCSLVIVSCRVLRVPGLLNILCILGKNFIHEDIGTYLWILIVFTDLYCAEEDAILVET